MTVLTFPSSPIEGQVYNAPNGLRYVYDGVKWAVETTTSTSEAVSNSTQDRVAPMFVNGEHNGISFTYNAETNALAATVTAVNGDQLINGVHTFTLESNGNISLPNNVTVDTNSGNFSVIADNYITLETLGPAQIEIGRYSPSGSLVIVGSTNTPLIIDSTVVRYSGDITQSAQDNTACPTGVDTVIYTATAQYQHAVKLFVMVEGFTDGGGVSWDTQACDVIAVKGYNNNIVHVTTYGVTYSGTAAIATFDGQWNATTNRIEITCTPVSATNSVVASVHAIEMTSND